MTERLLRCSAHMCPVEIVLMLPRSRAWHRHIGGILHEMREVYPAADDTIEGEPAGREGAGR